MNLASFLYALTLTVSGLHPRTGKPFQLDTPCR